MYMNVNAWLQKKKKSVAFLLKCTIIKYSSCLRGHASFLQVNNVGTSVPYPLLACRDESEVAAPQ